MCVCTCTHTEDTRAPVSQSRKFRDCVEMILWIHTYMVHGPILGMDRRKRERAQIQLQEGFGTVENQMEKKRK